MGLSEVECGLDFGIACGQGSFSEEFATAVPLLKANGLWSCPPSWSAFFWWYKFSALSMAYQNPHPALDNPTE